jgi:uncharacterized membrane protein YvlD (DUF360 family)
MVFGAIGAVALGLALTLYLRKKLGRFLTIMMLALGFASVGLLSQIVKPLLNMLGGLGLQIGFSTAFAAAALLWVFQEIKEKKTDKKTPWIALLLPTFLALSTLPIFQTIYSSGTDLMRQSNTSVSNIGK